MELQNGYITIYLLSSPDGQREKEGGGREKGKERKGKSFLNIIL